MPSAVKVPGALLKPVQEPVQKEKSSSVKLPVYKLPGQEGSREVMCRACGRIKLIPRTRRVFADGSICNDCFENGGDNIVMQGVDEAHIAAWVGAHCPGSVRDALPSSVRKAFLGEGEDDW